MALEDALNDLLKNWLLANAGTAHVVGKAVNVTDQKCDVEREGAPTIFDVSFCAIEDAVSNKIVVKPKDGSYVLVGFIEATHEGKEADAFY